MDKRDVFAQQLVMSMEEAKLSYSKYTTQVRNCARLQIILGKTEEGAALYRQSFSITDKEKDRYAAYGSYLLSLHYRECPSAFLFKEHKKCNTFYPEQKYYEYSRAKEHKKIRIGYISPDFRQNVMFYFYHVLLTKYDKNEFEVYCYSLKPEDKFTEYLKGFVSVWRNEINISPRQIAEQIYHDEIDILFDLAGQAADSGLPVLAYKPAPIQISGLGYVNTTGVLAVDYFLTDSVTDPIGKADEYFSEKLLRMDSCQFCYTGRSDVPLPGETACKKNGYITFASFNNFAKITDTILVNWLEILQTVHKSVLLLKSQVFVSLQAVKMAEKRLGNLGYDLSYVFFEPATDTYMEDYLRVDIALDTYPYPGGGTTCDALYMGVPVVSMYGETHGSRFGYSILKNIGLEELSAKSWRGYKEIAIGLAQDEELLNALHKTLRERMLQSALMDEDRYIRSIETVYKKIYIDFWGKK